MSPSADEKRLAELRDFLTNPQSREQVAGMMWRDSGMFLLRLLDAAQARLLQAERERDEARNAWHVPATIEALAAHDRQMRQAAKERASALAAALSKVYDWMLREYAENDPRTGEVVDKSVLPLFTDICEALSRLTQPETPKDRGTPQATDSHESGDKR